MTNTPDPTPPFKNCDDCKPGLPCWNNFAHVCRKSALLKSADPTPRSVENIAEKLVIELLEYDNMDFNDEERHYHERRVTAAKDAILAAIEATGVESALAQIHDLTDKEIHGDIELRPDEMNSIYEASIQALARVRALREGK